ncbi:alpha/beta fold hydrolase [Paenibacillus sp. J5C_2022]|uniref:alpha/beta fold hydrolase n=1 Tax=Paenibacillus sp. J5C2022 TaxID=2977129 RepID=UPI0021CFA5CF|nr:alpha/beta fold hydrolase [Paenibacillus sp. J5C2022]MCU6709112.1 alpha/beta fold hydrolase [Paenibacillus sp. J5C2022]
MMVVLMTGSTGFIGKEVLRQWAGGEEKLLLLVRSAEKTRAMLEELGLGEVLGKRIHLLRGDLAAQGLGLSQSDRERALGADVIIHAGGPMDITLGEAAARRMFLDGARYLAELASEIHRAKGLRHMIHVVGYMSPFHEGNVTANTNMAAMEKELDGVAPYEKMKFLADLYIRQQALKQGYPLSVVNPSTVIGARPSGATEQTGGLGILVHAVRNRLMPVVPGGADYWVPMVTNDVIARAIIRLAGEQAPQSGTYHMLDDKAASPDMKELLDTIAGGLGMPKPRGSVPVGLLRKAMGTGLGRLTGIPVESMAFITNKPFPTARAKELLRGMDAEQDMDVRDVLPLVVADLDYRLSNPGHAEPAGFARARAGRLAALVRGGDSAGKVAEVITSVKVGKETETTAGVKAGKGTETTAGVKAGKETETTAGVNAGKGTETTAGVKAGKETETTASVKAGKKTETTAGVNADKSESASEGVPWLLVHGVLGGAEDLAPLADRLHALSGAPVWTLDLPGFGRSPSAADGGPDALAAAVAEAAAELGSRVRLVGHSAGAVIAARAAALLQDGLEELILLQPVLHRPRRGVLQRALGVSPAAARMLLRRMKPRALAAAMRRSAGEGGLPPGYAAAASRRLSSPRIASANAGLLRALYGGELALAPEELARLGRRARIVWGEGDGEYRLPDDIPSSIRVKRVPHGHYFPLNRPEETAKWLLER